MAEADEATVVVDAEKQALIAKTKAAVEEKRKATAAAKEVKVIVLLSHYDLYEPYLNIRFKAGQKTEVPELTSWMKCQIAAKLMEEV